MPTLAIRQDGPVLRVALDRPQVRNAFNDEVLRELSEVFGSLTSGTRVIVLSGNGAAFCAGADLDWMKQSATFTREENERDAAALARLFEVIDEAPVVVVGRLHGAAMGGGVGLLACCDIVVAADDAKVGLTEVRLGLVPAVISPFVLAKIGASQARRYFVTGEVFSAAEARRIGLVHEVVPPAELDATIERLVAAIAKNGPHAVATAKRLVRDVAGRPPRELRDYTAQTIATLRVSPEGQEGLRAFLEKREPRFP